MTRETIEIVWPDENFSQFGGHVLERLFQTKEEMSKLRDRRYLVRVTIETFTEPPASVAARAVPGAAHAMKAINRNEA